ncbi:MAG: DUF2244 domain-containing protein [Gammaproteobacteria bacterium]|nr:DUF2244 domain-containing protein [Gammaproteobacteria bacterium]
MRIELSPNCSLSPQGARRFFASVCVASMSVALPLTFMGYWPVLPFAGAELALLFWALRASMARRHEKQTITILAETVEIEDCRPPRQSCVVFPRHWAQVRICTGGSPLHPSRLTVESHGRRHEIGSFLNEQERQALASRLRCLIGRVAESPPLPAQSGSTP